MGCSFLAPIQNAIGKVADVVLPIAAVVPGPWQVPAQVLSVVSAVDKGGIKAAIPALLSTAIGSIVPAGSLTGSVVADAAIKGAAVAGATGGDALTGAVMGGIGAGLSSNGPAGIQPSSSIFNDTTSNGGGNYDFSPSYSLADGAPSTSGFRASNNSGGFGDSSSPVDYSFGVSNRSDGLNILGSPSLNSMGGGQGITMPVSGGTVGSLGFTPTGASPILGNPNSFINKAGALGGPVMGMEPEGMTAKQQADLLKSIIGMFGQAGTASLLSTPSSAPQQQQPAYQPASTMPVYSPEYFQQVQQGYDRLLPSMPADVATPLSQLYNQPSSVNKLFGVI